MLSKPVIQNKGRKPQSIWLVVFIAVWIVAAFSNNAESTSNIISLNPTDVDFKTIRVGTSVDVKISNDSQVTIHNFTIVKFSTGKKMLSIDGLKPSASFNLAFDRAGTYVACYSKEKDVVGQSTCLQIEVTGLRSA
ncbi:MAG: hypothetical protein QGI90_00750 [Nitrospinaceae bacterium]|nr:hypothetical protein [Nitrospinaceae bacterium]